MAATSRIEYIDHIKGFAILWIVAFHLGSGIPAWMKVYLHVPLFFFVSGMFFSTKLDFKPFLIKKINALLIPFLFFLILGDFTALLSPFISGYTPSDVQWHQVFSIKRLFCLSNPNTLYPLGLNYPLWFLIALFNIQILYYFIRKHISSALWLTVIGILFFTGGHALMHTGVNGLALAGLSGVGMLYFALGNTFGGRLSEYTTKLNCNILILIVSVPLFIALRLIIKAYPSEEMNRYLLPFEVVTFIPVVFVVFRYLANIKPLATTLALFGRNSLTVMGMHVIAFSLFGRISFLIIGSYIPSDMTVLFLTCKFIFAATLSISAAILFNKLCPSLVGKGELIKTKKQWR